MKIYHYAVATKFISCAATITLLTLCFINPGWILIAIFFLPFFVLFALWTLMDSTTLSIENDIIQIKERKRLLTDNFKFHKKNVLKLKVIQQGFVNKTERSSAFMPFAAFDQVQSDTKAYKKAMIAVQTKKRVIRIGKTFNKKELQSAYEYLIKQLK
ncbi:MAG: hypothetical protein CMP67_08245 [Flavobacteriales bacterium]|nr:hypothetical protein [Flavobacteriales bacterium]MBO73160.1 hypothetical protein [Flavobacteriales bacterium]|tara:strand:+ start:629 stop:1099 length:471 start_codon:yes stop_codon:yes gene_type:complete